MSVSLHEVMSAAHGRAASLAAEVAGYLVLAAADQISGAPRAPGVRDISLTEEGAVRIAGGRPSDDASAEAQLRELLAQLLALASSVTPALFRSAQRASGAGVDALIRELEAALVPVNRGAARRALSRLHRDVARAKSAGLAPYEPESRQLVAAPPPEAPPPSAPVEPEVAPVARPVVHEPAPSVELPGVFEPSLAPAPAVVVRDPERSWLTPETVTVMDVVPQRAEVLHQDFAAADELETVIPIYVEEDDLEAEPEPDEAVTSPIEAREAAEPVFEVPDLDVPPSPEAPESVPVVRAEPATVPQPPVVRASRRSESAEPSLSRTPTLGTRVAELEPPELGPLMVSEPAPAVLELAGEDATERMPPLELPRAEVTQVELLLEAVADAFGEREAVDPADALATLDPPDAQANAEPVQALVPETMAAPVEEPVALQVEEPVALQVEESVVLQVEEPVALQVEESVVLPVVELVALPVEDPDMALVVEAALAEPSEALTALTPSPLLVTPSALPVTPSPLPLTPSPWPVTPSPVSELTPLPDIDPNEPELLASLPTRPGSGRYAPPRYAPKKSDVEALLSGFSVAGARTDRELCLDLKALAGVEGTAPPPAVMLDETPPPVAVLSDDDASDGDERGAHERAPLRAAVGAVSALVLLVGLGLGLGSKTIGSSTAGAKGVSAAVGAVRVGRTEPAQACAAEVTVRQLPRRARARIRSGSDGPAREPSRISGGDAVFEGLPCQESAEVTVELASGRRWVKIPVSADALAPSAAGPSLVRYAVVAR